MPVLAFRVPGRPISLNETYEKRRGQGGLRMTDQAKDYFARIQMAAVGALGHIRCPFTRNVVLVAEPYFTREADAGAVAKIVQDALEGLAYENDKVVLLAVNRKCPPDPVEPHTAVTLWEAPADQIESECFTIATSELHIVAQTAADFAAILPPEKRPSNRRRLVPSVRRYR